MNKITLALDAVMAITAALALTTMSSVMTQQAPAAGTNSTLSPCALAALRSTAGNSTNSTAGNSTNSTAGNSSHIVKSDLLFSGNNIIKIAANNPAQDAHPPHTPPPCPLHKNNPQREGSVIEGKSSDSIENK
ncbi:MAG: hypothetical protein M3044_13560 [Thermoproteota archaeon]|nr:hypothetical protein [Thermoproteota archaeon]